MKYSCRFSNKVKTDDFDEINIIYDRQDREFIEFMQKHINQTIVLTIENINEFYEAQEWKKLNAIATKYPEFNFKVCFFNHCVFSLLDDKVKECMMNLNVPYFTGHFVTNFDQLHYLLEQKVSDVYLVEDICFDLRRAMRVCSSYGAQIRTIPNVGQSSIKTGPALKKFFIRPEDVEVYEDVIDTLEFWGPLDRQEILLSIYKKGTWFGDLKDLILDFDLSFDSRRIMPGFAQMRKNCARKCMKGNSCSICDKVYNISKKLEDKSLIIKQKKID